MEKNDQLKMNITFPSLDNDELQWMVLQVSEDEVKRVMFAMNPSKTLGPYEFPLGFIKNCGI